MRCTQHSAHCMMHAASCARNGAHGQVHAARGRCFSSQEPCVGQRYIIVIISPKQSVIQQSMQKIHIKTFTGTQCLYSGRKYPVRSSASSKSSRVEFLDPSLSPVPKYFLCSLFPL